MSDISSIASLATAQSTAELQMQVAAKVLKMAQDSGQVVTELVSAAAENLEESIGDLASGLGGHVDAYA